MAYLSPQAPAPAPAARSGPARAEVLAKTLAARLWMPLLFMFAFMLFYLLPFHAPAPHGVKVAVAGSVSAADISAGLQQQPSGAFEVIPVPDAAQAREQVLDQAAQAAFVVNGTNATMYTAGANGSRMGQVVIAAFTPVAVDRQLNLSTVDLVPPVPGDPAGTALYYLAIAWGVVPMILNLQLLQATGLSRRAKLAVVVNVGAFASIVVFLIAFGLGAIPGQPLAILYGFLGFEAVSLTVFGLAPFLGRFTAGVAALLFVFSSVPSSGGSVPYQMVPTFFMWLHPILPMGNVIDATRSICYFDGTNMIRPTLVLCAWIAIGSALITASALLERARRRQAAATVSADAVGGATRELYGPGDHGAATVGHPVAGAPTAHVLATGHRADGFGRRSPALFGRVTDAAGVPLHAAHITVIDAHGHQLLRTSTDRDGRYAADAIPDDRITLLVSPPGGMPVATRVLLASDLPVRQDVVIPDPARSAAVLS